MSIGTDRPISLWGGKPLCMGYRLIQLRGQGGFGQVWEAESPEGEKIALKFIPCDDHMVAAEELRNIQRVRQLRHPNLIRIDKVWADRGYVVVAMELAEGSLADLLQVAQSEFGAPLPMTHVCEHLSQGAKVLDFLNARSHSLDEQVVGIQHGDVKPGNLLLFGDVVKLCDFGLSRVMTADLTSHRRVGTLAYAAPEVFQGRISRWADQYSLAVTYYELRTGKLPFPRTPTRFGTKCGRPEPDLSLVEPGERKALARALAPGHLDRWESCSEMVAELCRAAG